MTLKCGLKCLFSTSLIYKVDSIWLRNSNLYCYCINSILSNNLYRFRQTHTFSALHKPLGTKTLFPTHRSVAYLELTFSRMHTIKSANQLNANLNSYVACGCHKKHNTISRYNSHLMCASK